MTADEADEIIRLMKSGAGFTDDDGDYFTSYTYDAGTQKFRYMHAWTVIGSVLSDIEYPESDFKAMLMQDFSLPEIKAMTQIHTSQPAAIAKPEKFEALKVKIEPKEESAFLLADAIKTHSLAEVQRILPKISNLNGVLKDQMKHTPLTLACTYGSVEIANALIAAGADINLPDDQPESPLGAACGSYVKAAVGPLVKMLFEKGARLTHVNTGEDGFIHHAATAGSLEAVKLLADHGVSVNTPGAYKRTALMYAATDGNSPELVDFLIKSGAHVNARNEGGENVLFEMATRGEINTKIAALILDAGIDISYRHPSYGTALSWAANCGRVELVRMLIDRGADVNAGLKKNESPIVQAMMGGHHEIVKILFNAGADVNSKNFGGWGLLEYASEQKDEELVQAILDRQKTAEKSNKDVGEALSEAAQKGNISMLQLLLKNGADLEARNRWGHETPLMKAAYYGQVEAVAWLLDHGAKMEARDSRGNTALLHAAWMGKCDVVKLLLERGAEVQAVNNLNWNALMQAALEGHVDVAKILLQHGSRTDLIDKEKGANVHYLAKRSGSKALLELLEEHGAKPRQFRELNPGEDFVDIRECEYCQYIPQRKELANAESLGDYPGLVELHSHSTDVDRYATSTIEVYKCKLCGTYYQNDHYIDTEDSFVAGPTIHRHLQRFNFERLKMAFAEYQLTEEALEFSTRLPQLIAIMKKGLAREGSSIHPHFLPYFIENVTDKYILTSDWAGLKRDLLSHADKILALRGAEDLITIVGDGKYASTGGEQVYKAYRHITPDVFTETSKLLKKNRKEFREILEAIQKLPEHSAAAKKVLESADYYKV